MTSGTAATRKKAVSNKEEKGASGSPKAERTRVNVDFEKPLLQEIEDWRFSHKFGSRQEAIRELIRKGMKVAK